MLLLGSKYQLLPYNYKLNINADSINTAITYPDGTAYFSHTLSDGTFDGASWVLTDYVHGTTLVPNIETLTITVEITDIALFSALAPEDRKVTGVTDTIVDEVVVDNNTADKLITEETCLDVLACAGIDGCLCYFETTYAEAQVLIDASELVQGALYKITDRGDNGIFLTALSSTEFQIDGVRFMLVPATYASITDDSSNVWLGVWNDALIPTTGDLVIWGGKVWKSVGGLNTLPAVNDFTLDSEWDLITKTGYDNNEYLELQLNVSFDWLNDWIEKQWDGKGNVFGVNYTLHQDSFSADPNLVDVSDWNYGTKETDATDSDWFYGNVCAGVFNNVLPEGNSIYGNYLLGSENPAVIKNNTIDGDINGNRTDGDISGNTNSGSIVENFIDGGIYDNSNNGNIEDNTCNGSISLNSNSGEILNNSNNGSIEQNSNSGNISFNSSKGDIAINTNSGDIANNSNLGDIVENSCTGMGAAITYNSNLGSIDTNSNNGYITNNANLGDISSNANNGETSGVNNIEQNSNNGSIVSNINFGVIDNNSNNGNIGSNSNTGYISNNNNNGAITDNSCNNEGANVAYNSNNGVISANTNAGQIGYNSNNGAITNNLFNGETASVESIHHNSNEGDIDTNTNSGSIYNNGNGGNLSNNSNNGDIFNNFNTDTILTNSNNGDISSNTNAGAISANSNGGGILANANNGNITSNAHDGYISQNLNNGYIAGCTGSGGFSIFTNVNNGNINGVAIAADVTDATTNKT